MIQGTNKSKSKFFDRMGKGFENGGSEEEGIGKGR